MPLSRPRCAPPILRAIAVAVLYGWVTGPALAWDLQPRGDGSETTNPDLLGDVTSGCENCEPEVLYESEAPYEFGDPWFDLDWSVALRGAFVQSTNGSYLEGSIVPRVGLRHDMLRGGYDFEASAEISRSTIEELRVGAVRGAFGGEYQLDGVTGLTGNIDLSMTQDSASGPGADPNIAVQPIVIDGEGEVAVLRDIGLFQVTGRANGGRTTYGPTTMIDASVVDNSHQSNWRVGGGLRLGYRVTPILTVFADGSVGYQLYDAPSPTYLAKLDAADYQLRTGVAAKWNEVLEAEASVGLGLRRFADPMFSDVVSTLYDASVTYRPDETLTITGGFATEVGAPGADSGGTARVQYEATGDISYRVNPWLLLRASAGWRQADLVGTNRTESGWDAGVGLDYTLNEWTTLTADYAYDFEQTSPDPGEDSHRVTLGVTFSK